MKEIKQDRDECVKVFYQHKSNHSNEELFEGMKHTSSNNMEMHLHYSPHISTILD